MNIKKVNITLKERIRNLKNKDKDKINNFTDIKRINIDFSNNNIYFQNFSQLKSKIFTNHFRNNRNYLKNQRLNEIFDKEKNYNCNSLIKKIKQVFKETYDFKNHNKSCNYINNINNSNNKSTNNQLNSKLLLYLNKIKNINSKNIIYRNNNFNRANSAKNIIERKINNIFLNNNYTTFYEIIKSTRYNNLNSFKKENIYKNINNKISFNRLISSTKNKSQHNLYENILGNNNFKKQQNNNINNNKKNKSNSMGHHQKVNNTKKVN